MKNAKAAIVTATLLATKLAVAQAAPSTQTQDLTSMNLEELMKVQVTTESKQPESLSKVPAAVYVVTQEMIRRSGAINIPEVLRTVPGVLVAQVDASKYLVTIRGMGSRYADKLLVLVDGRTVYTPLFSGVYWDAQDIDLDQVERIEVIRGPGGTLWGANAVNGIINIITKPASETLGNRVTFGSSGAQPGAISISHGAEIPNGSYRVYARTYENSSLPPSQGPAGDNSDQGFRGGVRTDWKVKNDSYTFTSDGNTSRQGQDLSVPAFTTPASQFLNYRYDTSEWYGLGKWERLDGSGKGSQLLISFDHYDRGTPDIGERNNEFSADFQRPILSAVGQKLIGGVGYNVSTDTAFATPYIVGTPATRTNTVYSGFLHDEIELKNSLTLSLGTKMEHNSYTGWEFQPSGRLLYDVNGQQSFWIAASRAVRTPSRADTDSNIFVGAMPGPYGTTVQEFFKGNPNFQSETEVSEEFGWRDQPSPRYFVDVATFYSQYSDLRGGALSSIVYPSLSDPYVTVTGTANNSVSATTAGIELATHFAATKSWNLDGSYSLYSEKYDVPSSNVLTSTDLGADTTPHNMASIRSQLDLPNRFEFDVTGYYVSAIASGIPAYGRLDLRLGWHANSATELSCGVTNLTSQRHLEAPTDVFDVASLVETSFYVKATIHF